MPILRNPLILLGIDAGDPGLIEHWMGEGYLPTFSTIAKNGWQARTIGPEMICEHGIWVSLVSGSPRKDHGYYMFRQLRPGTYELEPRTGVDAQCTPFWAQLADLNIAVVDVPDTAPIPGLSGIQVSDWAVHSPFRDAAFDPPSLRRPQIRIDEQPVSTLDHDRKLYSQLISRVRTKGEYMRQLLKQSRYDFVAVVFGESHTAGHQFWRYRNDGGDLQYAIRDIYQAIDEEFAALLKLLPDPANVVIVSSVGMQDQWPCGDLTEEFCRKLGFQSTPQAAQSSPDLLTTLRKFVPQSLRNRLSSLLPISAQENLVSDKFLKSTDWKHTRAFAIPSWYTGFIRVNLRGREPEGMVEPGPEYLSILGELESELARLIEPRSGEPAVQRTIRSVDAFGPEVPRSLPDLFVEWRPCDYFLETVQHPKHLLRQGKPVFFRGTDHCREGFIAAAGPGVPVLGRKEVDLLEVAPLLLSLAQNVQAAV